MQGIDAYGLSCGTEDLVDLTDLDLLVRVDGVVELGDLVGLHHLVHHLALASVRELAELYID